MYSKCQPTFFPGNEPTVLLTSDVKNLDIIKPCVYKKKEKKKKVQDETIFKFSSDLIF